MSKFRLISPSKVKPFVLLISAILIVSLILLFIANPFPAALSSQSSGNLEPLSAFYKDANAWGYAQLDNTVLHNGSPSIRVGPDYVRGSREVDGAWIGVRPGDHVVMSVWVKTGNFASTDPQAGAVFGFDFYAHTSIGNGIIGSTSQLQAGHPDGLERGWGASSFGYTIDGENGLSQVGGYVCRVPWGTDWTQLKWDFYVPSTYYNYVWTTIKGGNGVFPCSSVQIDAMVPWFEGRYIHDDANIWYSEPQLTINSLQE